MPVLRPLDPSFPIERQLALEAGPVVLINVFTLDKADEQALLDAWQEDASFMKQQTGFISTQLHRAIGDSATFLNYAVWESNEHFRTAFTHLEFQARLAHYPASAVVMPHLFPEDRRARHLRRLIRTEARRLKTAISPRLSHSLVRSYFSRSRYSGY